MPEIVSFGTGSGSTPDPVVGGAPSKLLLELRGVSKNFGAVSALSDVDLRVDAGEVVALVGDNGAGKSTLIKVVAGVHTPAAGEIYIEGRAVRIGSPSAATALGIATVYQDLALCENLDVAANLFLGRERAKPPMTGRLRRLSDGEMEAEASAILSSLAVSVPAFGRPVAALSGGQRQSVAVARAVLWGSKLVLLDEPTAALGVEQTQMVLELIVRLRDRGLGVLLISHNLADVFEVADRIVVLRLGRNGGTFDAHNSDVNSDVNSVVTAITGGHPVAGRIRTPLGKRPANGQATA